MLQKKPTIAKNFKFLYAFSDVSVQFRDDVEKYLTNGAVFFSGKTFWRVFRSFLEILCKLQTNFEENAKKICENFEEILRGVKNSFNSVLYKIMKLLL